MLLHKHYDWQLIESLPLSALDGLLSCAAKGEAEKYLLPLWFVDYTVAKLTEKEPAMDFAQFVETTMKSGGKAILPGKRKRTPAEIEADLMRLVETDRQKGG